MEQRWPVKISNQYQLSPVNFPYKIPGYFKQFHPKSLLNLWGGIVLRF